MIDLLESLNLIDRSSVAEFYPRVRDREDVKVLRCAQSGIIFLSRSDHIGLSFYEQKELMDAPGVAEAELLVAGEVIKTPLLEDAIRREADFGDCIIGKRWLDVGTGYGAILDRLASKAETAVGVEPNSGQRSFLGKKGYEVYASIDDLQEKTFDVITLFHVFEHFTQPVKTLVQLRRHLSPGGIMIIEVPHARDFLLQTLDCDTFKSFTFWSEHLILHTQKSLEIFIRTAGFQNIRIEGYQRYPLANHLHWLARQQPGGQKTWAHLDTEDIRPAYLNFLQSLDQTDTLVAFVRA
jgi:2-polyprenyl-3-methyl-5-hydroxy-6-metoxy-1,4-benzoquinol methylase